MRSADAIERPECLLLRHRTPSSRTQQAHVPSYLLLGKLQAPCHAHLHFTDLHAARLAKSWLPEPKAWRKMLGWVVLLPGFKGMPSCQFKFPMQGPSDGRLFSCKVPLSKRLGSCCMRRTRSDSLTAGPCHADGTLMPAVLATWSHHPRLKPKACTPWFCLSKHGSTSLISSQHAACDCCGHTTR